MKEYTEVNNPFWKSIFQHGYKIDVRTENIVLYLAMYVRKFKVKILNVKIYETHSLVTLSCVRYSVISSSFLCSL